MRYFKRPALACALVGIMAATLEVVKLALAILPNIEAVTLFCAIFGYCFGSLGVLASFVFVFIEPLIYGFGTWFLSYLIYWPTLTLVFALLGARGRASRMTQGSTPCGADGDGRAQGGCNRRGYIISTVIYTAIAVGMTFLFGILSSLIEVGLFSGAYDNFLYRFLLYYIRGAGFYIAQIMTNLILFPLFFLPLCRTVEKIKPRAL